MCLSLRHQANIIFSEFEHFSQDMPGLFNAVYVSPYNFTFSVKRYEAPLPFV